MQCLFWGDLQKSNNRKAKSCFTNLFVWKKSSIEYHRNWPGILSRKEMYQKNWFRVYYIEALKLQFL